MRPLLTATQRTPPRASLGVPIVQPPGGHAIYLDARAFLPHIPQDQFPVLALAAELYLEGGIRSVEIGTLMFAAAAKMDLVRLASPRCVHTQSHIDYVVEVILEVWNHRAQIPGMQLTYEAPFLAPLNRTLRTGESRNGHTCVSCARECGEWKNSRVPHSSVAAFATLEPALSEAEGVGILTFDPPWHWN
jgi:hypothetical protein